MEQCENLFQIHNFTPPVQNTLYYVTPLSSLSFSFFLTKFKNILFDNKDSIYLFIFNTNRNNKNNFVNFSFYQSNLSCGSSFFEIYNAAKEITGNKKKNVAT